MSRATIGRVERGLLGPAPKDLVVRVARSLGIRIEYCASMPGGDLSRIVNERHNRLGEDMLAFIESVGGWVSVPEVSYSIYGERGIIDILCWHADSRTLLIIELKTAIVDPQELVGRMDARRRLASQIARQRGWDPAAVACWVVVVDNHTNRRRVDDHRSIFRAAFPADGRSFRGWLARPTGAISGLSFWPLRERRPRPAKVSKCSPGERGRA